MKKYTPKKEADQIKANFYFAETQIQKQKRIQIGKNIYLLF